MKSNIEINKPDKVIFWTNNAPYERNWFNLILSEYSELIEIKNIDEYTLNSIEGNEVPHLSHQADILKAFIVRDYGGIYSDLDSLALKSFPDEFYESKVPILCTETFNGVDLGLCMGFFLSPKGSKFFDLILKEYKDYDKDCDWGEFAVKRPLNIYKNNVDLVKVISSHYFEPIYLNYKDRVDLFHLDKVELTKNSYQLHLWENINRGTMKYLNLEYMFNSNTTYSIIGRKYLTNKIYEFDEYK
jgi:hypothetical protein